MDLNIILQRVNNFDIKQKKAWNICFIIFPQHQTGSGKIKANKTANFSHNTSFFVKTELQKLPVSYLKSLLSKNSQLFVKIA